MADTVGSKSFLTPETDVLEAVPAGGERGALGQGDQPGTGVGGQVVDVRHAPDGDKLQG
jgi:hypothetical protein